MAWWLSLHKTCLARRIPTQWFATSFEDPYYYNLRSAPDVRTYKRQIALQETERSCLRELSRLSGIVKRLAASHWSRS